MEKRGASIPSLSPQAGAATTQVEIPEPTARTGLSFFPGSVTGLRGESIRILSVSD